MRLPKASRVGEVAAAEVAGAVVAESAAPQGASEKAAALYRGALTEWASVRTVTATQRDASHVVEGKVVKGVTATASAESVEEEAAAAAVRVSR